MDLLSTVATALQLTARKLDPGPAGALQRVRLRFDDDMGCLYRALLVIEPALRGRSDFEGLEALAHLRVCAARAVRLYQDPDPSKRVPDDRMKAALAALSEDG